MYVSIRVCAHIHTPMHTHTHKHIYRCACTHAYAHTHTPLHFLCSELTMPLWSVQDWRVRIACSYSALGVWRPIKLRGYGGRIKSKPFLSSYPTRQHLSSFVTCFMRKLSSAVFMLLLFLFVDLNNSLSNLLTPSNVERWYSKPLVYRMKNQLVVISLKCVMVALSYFKLQLLLSGDIETNPGPGE